MRTLKEGDRGATVELLQLALGRAKLSADAPDGIFGTRTRSTVVQLQQKSSLVIDGIVGPKTWGALYPYLTGFQTVRVKAGQSLTQITERYGSTVQSVLTANPGITADSLPPNTLLKVPLPFPVVPTDVRWSFDLLALTLSGLQARYPFLTIDVLGKTVLGRPIYQVTIGTGIRRAGYNAAHHANEWITTPILMKFLEQCAAGIMEDGNIGTIPCRRLFQSYTLDLVPMVNPDGVGFA